MAVTLHIYPNPGLTLTGGSMLAWVYSPFTAQWSRYPLLDHTVVSGTYTGPQGYLADVFKLNSRLGFTLNWLSSSLTGTTGDVLVRIDGFNSVLGMGA